MWFCGHEQIKSDDQTSFLGRTRTSGNGNGKQTLGIQGEGTGVEGFSSSTSSENLPRTSIKSTAFLANGAMRSG